MHASLETISSQLAAFNADVPLPLTVKDAFRWFAPPFLVDDAVFPRKSGPFQTLRQRDPSWDPDVATEPLREKWYPPQLRSDPAVTKAYNELYEVVRGYPSCDSLEPFPGAADPGFTCWNSDVHPRDVFDFPP